MPQKLSKHGNLPHWYMPYAHHFVTFRTFGSLTPDTVNRLADFRKLKLSERNAGETELQHRHRVNKLVFREWDQALESDGDGKWMLDSRVAALIRQSLIFLVNRGDFTLNAYSIMPNHVHLLMRFPEPPREPELMPIGEEMSEGDTPLSRAMHSLKSYTANEANKLLHREGTFWQREYFDHWVRDEDELERILIYINANAARAGLVERNVDYFWSSAHERFLIDADPCGWLAGKPAGFP